MRVLVTGATGLVGSHAVAALLAEGHVVRALARTPARVAGVLARLGEAARRVEAVPGDVTHPESVRAALSGCDAALHAAGLFSHDLGDAELMQRTNAGGSEVVLSACAAAGLDPVLHVSSMLALFPPAGPVMRADDAVRTPRGVYARTKADAERVARRLQDAGAPVVTVYPGSVQGPDDPTVGSGPALIADMLRAGRVLVTEGGLAYTDARDLARLLARLLVPGRGPRRILAPAGFLPHDALHRLLSGLTGRSLRADRLPGALLRLMGRAADLRTRLTGRPAQLTHEAAQVLTRSRPFDDAEARSLLDDRTVAIEQSFRDLLVWMHGAGVLEARHVGHLAAEVA